MTTKFELGNPSQIKTFLKSSVLVCSEPLLASIKASGVRTPAQVHDFRVAIKRLQTLLWAVRPLVKSKKLYQRVDKALGKMASKARQIRDLDVISEIVLELCQSPLAGVTETRVLKAQTLEPKRAAALAELETLLAGKVSKTLAEDLRTLAGSGGFDSKRLGDLEQILHNTNSKLWRKCKTEVNHKNFANLGEGKLHKLRLRSKRARYLTDLLIDVSGFAVSRRNQAYTKLQNILGDVNDLSMVAAWLDANKRELDRQGVHSRRLIRVAKNLRKTRKNQLTRVKELF